MIRFIHAGDIHFGVENYGRIDPQTGLHSRFKDFIKCFEKVVRYAIKLHVDFLLLCGDIYHTSNPSPTQEREFARCIMKLVENSIPTVILIGNHDNPVAFGKATSLDIFTELNIKYVKVISKPEVLTLDLGKNGKIQIACFPWPTRSRIMDKDEYKSVGLQELDEKLQKICEGVIDSMIQELEPGIPAIFAGHLAVSEASYSGSERTTLLGKDPVLLKSILARKDFAYVALGHIHKHQNLNSNSSPPVIYSGSIERVDFNEEYEDKGFCLVEINGRDVTYRVIKTPSRKLITIEVDVRERLDPTWEIISEIQKHSIEGSIIRIIYLTSSVGEKPLRHREITEALAPAFFVQGIIRKTEPKEITGKAGISENLSLSEALDKYIEQEQLDKYAADIRNYAKVLETEVLQYDTDNTKY